MAGSLPGKLARENAIRQPQRTAVTAAALMVGLALVVLVTVFAAGIRGSVTRRSTTRSRAALIVQNQDGFSPIPQQAADAVADVDGVKDVSPVRFSTGIFDGSNQAVTGIDPATISSVLRAQVGPGRRGDPERPDRLPGPARRQLGQVAQRRAWASTVKFTTPPARRRPTRSRARSRTRPA